jgi:hypothetical protein
MSNWFMGLDMSIQLFCAASIGMIAGMIFSVFGDIITPDDIV